MISSGGDIAAHFKDLGRILPPPMGFLPCFCTAGMHQSVKEILEMANSDMKERKGIPPPALIHLLETRETSMRHTPLLCLVAMGKNLTGLSPNARDQNQLEVARLLLRAGARPDAKDVLGKTACHYGAGTMATATSMEMVKFCSAAAESSHLFWRQVKLSGLNNKALNGKRGVCRGYLVETGRRAVYVVDKEKEIAVKPENLVLVNDDVTTLPIERRPKLCDIQDRLGGVALLEVFMSNRVDVARFLLDDLQASIEVADWDGYSPKSMAMNRQTQSVVTPLVMVAAMKLARADKKAAYNRCARCEVADSMERSLAMCKQWYVLYFYTLSSCQAM